MSDRVSNLSKKENYLAIRYWLSSGNIRNVIEFVGHENVPPKSLAALSFVPLIARILDEADAVLAICCHALVVEEKLTLPSSKFFAHRDVYSLPADVSDISSAVAV